MWQRAGTLTSQCSMFGCHRTVTTMRFQCWHQCWQEGGGSLLTSIFGYYSSVDYLLLGHYSASPSTMIVVRSQPWWRWPPYPWFWWVTRLLHLSICLDMVWPSRCGRLFCRSPNQWFLVRQVVRLSVVVIFQHHDLVFDMILPLSVVHVLFVGVWFLFRILACYSLGCIAWYERNTSLPHLIFCMDLYACFITSAWLCSSVKLI